MQPEMAGTCFANPEILNITRTVLYMKYYSLIPHPNYLPTIPTYKALTLGAMPHAPSCAPCPDPLQAHAHVEARVKAACVCARAYVCVCVCKRVQIFMCKRAGVHDGTPFKILFM